jgi:hypothetical protein
MYLGLIKKPSEAAEGYVYFSDSDNVEYGGSIFENLKIVDPSENSLNKENAYLLWNKTEKILNIYEKRDICVAFILLLILNTK